MNKILLVITGLFSIQLVAQEVGSGNTLGFDGVTTNIEYGELFNDVQLPITIEAWININSEGNNDRKVFFGSSWASGVYSGVWASIGPESMAVTYGDGEGWNNSAFRRSATANFNSNIENRWVHIAMVVKGASDMDLYLNGIKLNASYSGNGNSQMASVGVCIVGYNIEDNYFKGKIDELRLWNIARSQEDVRNDMCRKINKDMSGLVGYWQFNEGSGSQTQELISGINGNIAGNHNWYISGAPIGDSSHHEYFMNTKNFAKTYTTNDSIWITSVESDLQGYHLYKVMGSPNSLTGSILSFGEGYYGLFPILAELEKNYRVDFGDQYCTRSNFRNGNDDSEWEIAATSDSSNYFSNDGISELVFVRSGSIEPIASSYTICPQQSVSINAQSDCVISYNWFDSSNDSEITISEPGTYWLERITQSGSLLEFFEVYETSLNSELILEESITVCPSELPLPIYSVSNENITWNDGSSDSLILIESEGIFWVEQETICGSLRDSIIVSIIEYENPFIPNVITPNNDKVNDCFIVDEQLIGSHLIVINRAGIPIFEDTNYQNNWCPVDLSSGGFYYLIRNSCSNENYKGWLHVLH